MVIWIIDEEWNAYDVEISLLTKPFPALCSAALAMIFGMTLRNLAAQWMGSLLR